MRINRKWIVLGLGVASLTGCSSLRGSPDRASWVDLDPDRAQDDGYFVLGEEGKARGANPSGYISRGAKAKVPQPAPVQAAAPQREEPKTEAEPVQIVTSPVHFEFGKATLTNAGKEELQSWMEQLREDPEAKILIIGHTDSVGSEEFNAKLSQARAEAAREFLTEIGVPTSRLSTEALGETNPVASNSTDSGRMANRRVEAQVLP